MSMYNDVEVSLSLGDLSAILCAANCLEFADEKREELEKKNAELLKECETQAQEIHQLRIGIIEAEKEQAAWKQAANSNKPVADAIAYLEKYDTPFEDKSVEKACDVIRALLSRPQKPAKPANNDAEDLL